MGEAVGPIEHDGADLALGIELEVAPDAEDVPHQPFDPEPGNAGDVLVQPTLGPDQHIVRQRAQRDDHLLGGEPFLAALGDA